MALEEPTKLRFTIEESPDALTITIPSRREWFLTVFYGFLSILMFGPCLLPLLFDRGTMGFAMGMPFVLMMLIAWVMFVLVVIPESLWNIAGRQVVTLKADELSIENVIPGCRRSKEYRLPDAQALRVSPKEWNWAFRPGWSGFWRFSRGPLVFDYGAGTVRFGGELDEAEAKIILAVIARRCPQVCRNAAGQP